MGETSTVRRSIAAPTVPWKSAIITLVALGIVLFILDARARDFGTIAGALGLYSAGLLGVFGVLNSWRSPPQRERATRRLKTGGAKLSIVALNFP